MGERLQIVNKRAARAALALLAIASAGGLEAGRAEADPNPVIAATERHIQDIVAEMSLMMGRDKAKAYRDHPEVNGKKVKRDVVVYKEAARSGGKPLYDQVITYTEPGDKEPYILSWITGTPDSKFTIGEKTRTYFAFKRLANHPRTYHAQYVWPETKKVDGKKQTIRHNLEFDISDNNFAADIHLSEKSQMLDEMTGDAKNMVDLVSAELEIPPA